MSISKTQPELKLTGWGGWGALEESGHIWQVHVFAITVQLHEHYYTVVKTAIIGSFADPGHKTALYGGFMVNKNLQFSR